MYFTYQKSYYNNVHTNLMIVHISIMIRILAIDIQTDTQ